MGRIAWRSVAIWILGLGSVAAATAVCSASGANAVTACLFYLLAILLVARSADRAASIVVAVAAATLLNYFFLPPVGKLTIADGQNWVALGVFIAAALIASELSIRVRRQAREAEDQRRDVERLYALSRAVLLNVGEVDLGSAIARQIARIFEFRSVLIWDFEAHKRFTAGPEDLEFGSEIPKQTETAGAMKDGISVPVRLGNKVIGILAVRGQITVPALEAVANLTAISLEKMAGEEAVNQAKSDRRSEELRGSILDALAHEFKTPLTSIKAASTSLLSNNGRLEGYQHEMVSIIDEETNRLTGLVNEAIQVAGIESGKVRLVRSEMTGSELAHSVLSQMQTRLEGRDVQLHVDPNLPAFFVDRGLMELALRQLLDNALKYSTPESPIQIGITGGDTIRFAVTNQGSGIAAYERKRIFERFYRGEAVRERLPGTGLGLSVVRDIVLAHGGNVAVESTPDGKTTFTAEIAGPVAKLA